MNVLSLFDGISCGQIALNQLGIKVDNYYASEINPYSIKVTQTNYPNTKQVGDITKLYRGAISPHIDLLIGGSPCQGFSFMGKQLNLEDPRSKLFFEYVRILKEIKQNNPNVLFLLENVKMKKESQDIISENLGIEPILINSALFSAQNRNRLYWTNIPIDPIISNNTQVLGNILESNVDKKYYCSLRRANGIIKSKFLDTKPNNRDKKCSCLLLSNNRKFSVNNWDLYKTYESRGYITQEELDLLDFRTLTPIEYERLQTLPDNYTNYVADGHRYKECGNGWTIEVIKHLFKNL